GCGILAGCPQLAPVDEPAVLSVAGFGSRAGLHGGRVAAMSGFCQAESGPSFAFKAAKDELLFLLLAGRELFEHRDEREVADNAMLVLQVIVQPKPLCREMFAYDRHPQVRSVLAAIFLGRGKIGRASRREGREVSVRGE